MFRWTNLLVDWIDFAAKTSLVKEIDESVKPVRPAEWRMTLYNFSHGGEQVLRQTHDWLLNIQDRQRKGILANFSAYCFLDASAAPPADPANPP